MNIIDKANAEALKLRSMAMYDDARLIESLLEHIRKIELDNAPANKPELEKAMERVCIELDNFLYRSLGKNPGAVCEALYRYNKLNEDKNGHD